jgi:proline dehydrogenase
MDSAPKVSFENTEVAFSYKSDAALRKANLIFSLVNHPWMSFLARGFVKLAFKTGLPVEEIVRKTAFEHFCGGESIEKSEGVIQLLGKYHVGTILDYSVEGEKSENGFMQTMEEILRTIEKAQSSKYIPFCVFKMTGLASAELLARYGSKEQLTRAEEAAFDRLRNRVDTICARAHACGVPILIDAEQSWVQGAIDQLADEMMARYNGEKAIVYNTYQMYRTDSLANLSHDYSEAQRGGYFVGAKLVRGAYMEKERSEAEKKGYPSIIYPDKAATDKAFNEALQFCIDHIDRVYVMCGSHNEYSNALLIDRMAAKHLRPSDSRIWSAQLYGMSDNISFNLARGGYNVVKYVPYGPVKAVMPYLLRRAEENTSVAGQSSRELTLIRKEIKRRRMVRP